jgi:tetrahydromethanopterin S-methyltransferase subunit D
MLVFLAFLLVGAAIGFVWAWAYLTPNTVRTVAEVRSTPINEDDREIRLTRARTIGHIKGLRLGASLFGGALGAAGGLLVWAAWKVFSN